MLDTPGHEDLLEDMYGVPSAEDAAVMVIDAAKGVEAQTIKLLERLSYAQYADHHVHQQT